MQSLNKKDAIFRKFQIQKLGNRRLSPSFTMTINVKFSPIDELRREMNGRSLPEKRITVTHIVLKAVAETLREFPVLYSSFNGRKVVENPELMINVPVDMGNRVEYVVIRSPETMSIEEIAGECYKELENIRSDKSKATKLIEFSMRIPYFLRKLIMLLPGVDVMLSRKYYGNFVLSNIGLFGINSVVPLTVQPMISVLCVGGVFRQVIEKEEGQFGSEEFLPLTVTFDHRAVDGAYAGRYVSSLRAALEHPETLLKTNVSPHP